MHFHIAFLRESLDFTQNEAAACIWLPVGQEVQSFYIVKTEGFLKEHEQVVWLGDRRSPRNQLPVVPKENVSDWIPPTCPLRERDPAPPSLPWTKEAAKV